MLATHERVGRAELDLVAVDPGPPPALVVVEVRWRGRRDFGLPEETVDHRKRARLHRAGFALRERAGWRTAPSCRSCRSASTSSRWSRGRFCVITATAPDGRLPALCSPGLDGDPC